MLYVKHDLNTRKWECNFNPYEDIENDLYGVYIGFYRNVKSLEFNDLSFGYKLYVDNTVVIEDSEPKEGVTIVKTDQHYIYAEDFEHLSGIITNNSEIKIDVWCKESDIYVEDTFTFIAPSDIDNIESDGTTSDNMESDGTASN